MKTVFLVCLCIMPTLLNAQGFQVALQGQKQIAMGHTGTGLRQDAATVFFNPGAVSMLERNSISAGISTIFARTSYLAPEPGWYGAGPREYYRAETQSSVGTSFSLYGVWGPSDGTLSKFKVGIGVYTPFGSSVDWGDEWGGRFALQRISLQSIFIQPTLSYQITDNLGIGAGFVYAVGGVNLQRAFPIADANGNYGQVELDGSATGIGFNAGMFYQPADILSIGISYRSQVNMEIEEGDAIFTGLPASIAPNFPAGTQFTASLPLPQVASIGVGIYPSEKLTLALDVNFVGWQAYDTLSFEYNQATVPATRSPREYQNSWTFRLGGQYNLTEAFNVRAGAYYGLSPVQSGYLTPETPDSDRFGLSAGVGYAIGKSLELDASFLFINTQKRTDINLETGFGGTYKTFAFIPGISVGYNF